MNATEFKAHCFELLDRVSTSGEVIQVTKRGAVVAELRPPQASSQKRAKAGFARGRLEIIGDIMEPLDVEWEALGDFTESEDPLVKPDAVE